MGFVLPIILVFSVVLIAGILVLIFLQLYAAILSFL